MTGEPCRICADADRDFGPLVGSRGTGVPRGSETVAYNALVPWVAHVRDLPNAAAHLAALNLRTLSPRTAYLENVLRAAKDSTLMDHPSLKLAPASGKQCHRSRTRLPCQRRAHMGTPRLHGADRPILESGAAEVTPTWG